MFTIHYGVYTPLNIFVFVKAGDSKFDNPEHMWPSVIPRAIAQAIVCSYGFYIFYKCLIFIFNSKMMNLLARKRQLTRWNSFILIWAMLLATMKTLHAIISIFIVSAQRLWLQPKNPTFTVIYLVCIRSYSYLVDFLTMVSLLYLFYSQALLNEKQIKANTDDIVNGRSQRTISVMSSNPFNEVLIRESSTSSYIGRAREDIVSYQIASPDEEIEEQQELEDELERDGQLRQFLIHQVYMDIL